jgi:hypothetical protein
MPSRNSRKTYTEIDMIDLKDFMKAALQQITEAASEFQSEQGENGATLMPAPSVTGTSDNITNSGFLPLGGRKYATIVNFDVAITVDESESASAGGGIKILPFRVEGETGATAAQSSASRIQFPVTLHIPQKPVRGT